MIPWLEKTWCIPPKADTEFVARMEDLLELYQLPYDPRFPVVGRDEMPKQLIAETRIPLPAGGRCSSATGGPRWTGPSACG